MCIALFAPLATIGIGLPMEEHAYTSPMPFLRNITATFSWGIYTSTRFSLIILSGAGPDLSVLMVPASCRPTTPSSSDSARKLALRRGLTCSIGTTLRFGGGAPRTRDTGRVYRILPKESGAKDWDGRYGDIASMSNADLVALQLSESAWHARRACVVLQNRAVKGEVAEETHQAIRDILRTNTNGDHRLRALWVLHVTGGTGESSLLETLHDEDEYIRAWALQLLCEDKAPSNAVREQFVVMAEEDDSPVVRLYLASALQRWRRRIIAGLLLRNSSHTTRTSMITIYRG